MPCESCDGASCGTCDAAAMAETIALFGAEMAKASKNADSALRRLKEQIAKNAPKTCCEKGQCDLACLEAIAAPEEPDA